MSFGTANFVLGLYKNGKICDDCEFIPNKTSHKALGSEYLRSCFSLASK